jgi:hypothetical protein
MVAMLVQTTNAVNFLQKSEFALVKTVWQNYPDIGFAPELGNTIV